MTTITRSACCLLMALLPLLASALPQQQPPAAPGSDIVQRVEEIFTATQPPSRGGGFGRVVTSEPLDGTGRQPDLGSVTVRPADCTCIPYHMCNPSGGDTTGDNANEVDAPFDGFGLIDLRFGGADDNAPVCDHFLDVCCPSSKSRSVSLTPVPQEVRPNRARGCGIRNLGGIDFNITGANDNEAGFGEFPWTAALLHASNNSYFCSASLIHPSVLLTGIHCINDKVASSFVVRLGEWDTQTTKERLPYEERTVRRIILHPQFNVRNVANDFALLILNQPVTLGDHINTVCLPPQSGAPPPATRCFATGWGRDQFGANGVYSVLMKRVQLPIVEFGNCQEQLRRTRLGPRFVLDPTFICAGGQAGIDTCQGDGGAPLVCPTGAAADNRYEQSGIVAWGIGCKDAIPAAYANVAAARTWIDEQMLTNGFDTSAYTPF